MKRTAFVIIALLFIIISTDAFATQLVEIEVVDKDYIMVYFKDGDVEIVDDGLGPLVFTGAQGTDNNNAACYRTALDTTNAFATANWVIKSTDDTNYGATGFNPTNCYRKSRMSGMAEMNWDMGTNDWHYDYTMEHWLFLQLPSSLSQGVSYTIEINANTNSDVLSQNLSYDIFTNRSEAIHVNLVGYLADFAALAFQWLVCNEPETAGCVMNW